MVVWQLRRTRQLRASLAVLSWAVLGHFLFMHRVYRELREYTCYYFAAEIWWLAISNAFCSTRSHGSKGRFRVRRQGLNAVAALAALAVVSVPGREFGDAQVRTVELRETAPQPR